MRPPLLLGLTFLATCCGVDLWAQVTDLPQHSLVRSDADWYQSATVDAVQCSCDSIGGCDATVGCAAACGCQACGSNGCWLGSQFDRDCRFFGSVDLLSIRPHFSEAIAFAQGNQTLTSYNTTARPIHFDYDASVRSTIGMSLRNEGDAMEFTYSYLQGDVSIGASSSPGEFIVDPFGNVVGSVSVIDPSDARFNTTINGGDSIVTQSTVDTHVYDLDFTRNWGDACRGAVKVIAGVRIADVDQFYRSTITNGGAAFSDGSFTATFTGAGPHLGIAAKRLFGEHKRLGLMVSTSGALLLGDYHVASSSGVGGGAFVASQSNSPRRLIPVLESELGTSFRLTDRIELSGGWLFHLWNDLGVSGGTFGGFYAGADDANNMSFDGLFLRAVFRP